MNRKKSFLILVLLILLTVVGVVLWRRHATKQETNPYSAQTAVAQKQPNTTATPTGFDKKQFSLEDPTSLWVIVNKRRALPAGYAPTDLITPAVALRLGSGAEEMKMRKEAGGALKDMFAAAKADGYSLLLASGYRSEASQKALHAMYVAQKGAQAADLDSARAGYSEHQTGLAVDVGRADHKCEVEACFATTPEGQWVAKNAYKYGFVIRYKDGSQAITGYIYEPWHLRYVGKDLAKAVQDGGQTLEEFFDLPAAPDYK